MDIEKQRMDPRLMNLRLPQYDVSKSAKEGYAQATQLRPIENAMESLGKHIGELNQVIASLEAKIQPYLRSPVPIPGTAPVSEAYPDGSTITVGIMVAGTEIKSCIAALRSLMDRMD
jgi:hypothetical protein